METNISYSQSVRHDAERILADTNLVELLREFGEVNIGGSFAYDLMWGPDIDIVVVCENPRDKSVAALHKMVDLRLFQKYEYGDFEKFKRENRPEFFIMNLILPFNNRKWEIEVWFMDKCPDSQKRTDQLIADKLDDEGRTKILEMKRLRENSGMSKHNLSSVEIYNKVLSV